MISNKCYYALKAMLELAHYEGRGPIPISRIAASRDIPVRFLEAILRQLKHGGFTDSSRGKDGGYRLARAASQIVVGDVVRHFEGPFVALGPAQIEDQRGDKAAVFEEIWENAEQALAVVYDQCTFADLREREQKLTGRFLSDYSI